MAGSQATTVAEGVWRPWVRAQVVNALRHAAALRPFRVDEFGTGPEAPTPGHVTAVNDLLIRLRRGLVQEVGRVRTAARTALAAPGTPALQALVSTKEQAHTWVRAIERIWDFYFELFGQRQSRFGSWLLACDRIALDCYQHVYLGVPIPKSIPAPPPLAYLRTGFSPATFRRGIPLAHLGKQLNPYPLVQLPYHRLVSPWTLGAVLHEVSHNLQNELGLADAIPDSIARTLAGHGVPRPIALVFQSWQRETFADMLGCLMGGPAVVRSLFDVVARSPRSVRTFVPGAPHPTPYVRALLSLQLLRQLGFAEEALALRRLWDRIYPAPEASDYPKGLIRSLPETVPLVVHAIAGVPFPALGERRLLDVVRFRAKDQASVQEAAARLAAGTDPGVLPERFYIGAVRTALDQRLARADRLARNFYRQLARRA
ncbi:MAG: hypothetical protein IT458_06765 [Planctomycetes bacterium]|nr:hypothetical protein [Planctomycetota bacterium]